MDFFSNFIECMAIVRGWSGAGRARRSLTTLANALKAIAMHSKKLGAGRVQDAPGGR